MTIRLIRRAFLVNTLIATSATSYPVSLVVALTVRVTSRKLRTSKTLTTIGRHA